MTRQPAHDVADAPFWTVQAVFDPDGGGADFAYTIGLHDRGLPELHIWARPDRGDDPGEDWMLSMHDRTRLLNDLARRLLDGDLEIGTTITQEYDAGAVTAELLIGPPGDREALEAFGTAPDAVVWPVSWSLSRPPEGPNAPLDEAALLQAETEYAAAVATLDPERARMVPEGWQLPRRPAYDPDQVFGPRTPVVLARAAQLRQASVIRLNELLHHAIEADMAGSLTFPLSVARTAARTAGRSAALQRLDDAVQELVSWLTDAPQRRAQWREVLASIWGEEGLQERRARRSTTSLLADVTLACLSVDAVADVIDEEWLLAARGPYLAALATPAGELPGPEWAASPLVIDAVLDLLGRLPAKGAWPARPAAHHGEGGHGA